MTLLPQYQEHGIPVSGVGIDRMHAEKRAEDLAILFRITMGHPLIYQDISYAEIAKILPNRR
jgi:hypothetical protein